MWTVFKRSTTSHTFRAPFHSAFALLLLSSFLSLNHFYLSLSINLSISPSIFIVLIFLAYLLLPISLLLYSLNSRARMTRLNSFLSKSSLHQSRGLPKKTTTMVSICFNYTILLLSRHPSYTSFTTCINTIFSHLF